MKKYFLSICAIVRNEAPYIAEWIEFHKLQGVEHFYIYHNTRYLEDDLATWLILDNYEERGVIRQMQWRDFPGQFTAYNYCLENHGSESEWIAFIDVDEFLWSPEILKYPDYPVTAATTLQTNFSDPNIAVVAPRWVLFGSNGHKERTDGSVISRFTKRAKNVDKHCKSIVRPALVEEVGSNPHTFRVRSLSETGVKGRIVDERRGDLPKEYAVLESGAADILRINHYHTKSYAEYCDRKQNGTPDTGKSTEDVLRSFEAHNVNEIEDTTLHDLYADKINRALNGS